MNSITIILLLWIFNVGSAQAQLADEWLRQKRTQRKYLVAQIAALRQYAGLARKGYDVVGGGIRLVGQIKQGDLDIHSAFFSSLRQVSPFVRRHRKVLDLSASYLQLIAHCRKMKSRWSNSEALPGWQRNAAADAYLRFANEITQDLLFLTELLTDGRFELNDAERLAKVDELSAAQSARKTLLHRLSTTISSKVGREEIRRREILHQQTLLP
ncbi:hypothetical protein [Chitinophaga alhagiae]|uniref:hypothetical protein n=1 Tax=Chitinophaga alhagiae TaxID=2203219 RepID=UPI000E5BD9FE|nr:hypothetical protein [Chitinophaga alhagiae]